jgi:hypothetical protein
VHAEALLADLRRQVVSTPDPRVRSLIDDIATRLPADHDPDDYWTEVPELEPASPLLTLSPLTRELTTVVSAVLDAAREQGWVVHDGQAGEVWLPNGRVLRRGGSFPAPAVAPPRDEEVDSPAARATWLRRRLAPIFERHGYRGKPGEFWFNKSLPFGEATLYGRAVRDHIEHGLRLRLDYGDALSAALDSDGGPALRVSLHRLAARNGLGFSFNAPPALFQSEPGGVAYGLPCGSADALRRRGDELVRLYAEIVLPWLYGLQDFRDLDHWANRVPDDECPFNGLRRRSDYRLLDYHPDLLIARAVEAADFEAMARQRLALYESDAFGRGLLPKLRALSQICGLEALPDAIGDRGH